METTDWSRAAQPAIRQSMRNYAAAEETKQRDALAFWATAQPANAKRQLGARSSAEAPGNLLALAWVKNLRAFAAVDTPEAKMAFAGKIPAVFGRKELAIQTKHTCAAQRESLLSGYKEKAVAKRRLCATAVASHPALRMARQLRT